MNEFRVKVTVRNNLLLKAIEEAGFKNQSEFARACECSETSVQAIISLREAPIGVSGEFTKPAKAIMEVLGACPTDLWTEQQLTMSLVRNTREASMSSKHFSGLLEESVFAMTLPDPADSLIAKQEANILDEAIKTLGRREGITLRMRSEDSTLEEISDVLGVTRERVRQIEGSGKRRMKWKDRAEPFYAGAVIERPKNPKEEESP